MGWILPTNFSDPDNVYDDEPLAYDDDTDTKATTTTEDKYLILILDNPIFCDKIRIWARKRWDITWGPADVSIDVFYNGEYHNIHNGAVTDDAWDEISIGSTQIVSKGRVKHNDIFYFTQWYLYEFHFHTPGGIGSFMKPGHLTWG